LEIRTGGGRRFGHPHLYFKRRIGRGYDRKLDSKELSKGKESGDMAKQIQTRSQKEIDEEFAAIAAENIKKDKRLLDKLANA